MFRGLRNLQRPYLEEELNKGGFTGEETRLLCTVIISSVGSDVIKIKE